MMIKHQINEMKEQIVLLPEAFEFNLQEHPWLEMPLEVDDTNTETMRFALDEIRVK